VVISFQKDLQGLNLMIGEEAADADDAPLSPTHPAPQPNLLMMDNVFDNLLPSSICNQQWEASILFKLRHTFSSHLRPLS
jgi:hypothetical protein